MGRSMICAAVLVLMLVPAPVPVIAAVDNVAFQWTDLLSTLMCSQFAAPLTAGIQQQLHLAQWHSLLALRGIGGGTTEEAVVAYASWKILGHYFSFAQVPTSNETRPPNCGLRYNYISLPLARIRSLS